MYLLYSFQLLLLVVATCATPIVEKDNDEALKSYLEKYSTNFINPDLEPAQSKKGGDIEKELKFSENPLIVDAVMTLQETLGLNQTGTMTKDTFEKMNQARCGVKDPVYDPNGPGEYRVQGTWLSKRNLKSGLYTVNYSFPSRRTPKSLKFHEFKKGVTLAMCTWETISNIRFRNIGVGKNHADVIISFEKAKHGDGYPFDGRGGTLGHAFYPEDGRLHFDSSESWYLATPRKIDNTKKDIFNVALHELGHTLGLLHSKKRGAVMQPYYYFFGTFDTFAMPKDEKLGVVKMYGKRKIGDPSEEVGSACYEAKKKYNIDLSRLREKPTAATNVAVFEEVTDPSCGDDLAHARNCFDWKDRGFCGNVHFASVMLRRCKKTCGFCPGLAPKDKTPEKVSSLTSSICGIDKFDSMAMLYDKEDGLTSFIFKDDYYFQSKMSLSPTRYDTHTMLNDTDVLKGSYRWETDPKSIHPGLFKIKNKNFLHQTKKLQALIVSVDKYFAFEGDVVHYYRQNTEEMVYNKTYPIGKLFAGFPHYDIDAAHVSSEVDQENSIFTIFRGDKMWQYEEIKDPRQPGHVLFWPIENKVGIDIAEWHGVSACNIDSVFEYRGVPYFLKGNIFWPAVDSEPAIARDVTYNFFRCWQNEPENLSIPTTCETPNTHSGLTDDGNGAVTSQIMSKTLLIFIILFNSLFFNYL